MGVLTFFGVVQTHRGLTPPARVGTAGPPRSSDQKAVSRGPPLPERLPPPSFPPVSQDRALRRLRVLPLGWHGADLGHPPGNLIPLSVGSRHLWLRVAFPQDRRRRTPGLKVSQFWPFLQKQKCVHVSQVTRLGRSSTPLMEGIAKPQGGAGPAAQQRAEATGQGRQQLSRQTWLFKCPLVS